MQALADPNSMGKQFFPTLIQPIYFAHFEVDLRKLILESQTCSQRVVTACSGDSNATVYERTPWLGILDKKVGFGHARRHHWSLLWP